MTGLGPSTDPVLLEVTRGERVESVHRGRLVLLDAAGAVTLSLGDGLDEPVYARSSLKPLQALALVEAGFGRGDRPGDDGRALAMACASHDGEDVHREAALATLHAAGLDADALRCPPDLPADRPALLDYVAAGGRPSPVCHNCSGKHAAMLATCVRAGWDTTTYLALEHPLQQAILAAVQARCGPVAASSVDGCGAPAHALPLPALARGFARIARTLDEPCAATPEAAVARAMRAHPYLIGGHRRAVSELLAEVDGLLAKDGADGVWAAALPDGRAFAAKVADGSARALPPLLAAVLRYWGVDGPAVRRWSAPAVLGGGLPVGAVRWSAQLRDALGLPLP